MFCFKLKLNCMPTLPAPPEKPSQSQTREGTNRMVRNSPNSSRLTFTAPRDTTNSCLSRLQ